MMWHSSIFMRAFEKKGHAFFSGKFGVYPVNKASAVIIKKKEDLAMAESLLQMIKRKKEYKVQYDKTANFNYN